ncbi:hypothetical protein EDB92DRAFT_680255 [Lactarius akahatsu]|uniref:Secreted protein n=1 Tax=Lactarius akahatsu TaxID=416441 RepID=A0AAD4QAL8_9AGAM|nr:hypothetical protein EDB92DRAFT_680255 [Lactarius akahatsu]
MLIILSLVSSLQLLSMRFSLRPHLVYQTRTFTWFRESSSQVSSPLASGRRRMASPHRYKRVALGVVKTAYYGVLNRNVSLSPLSVAARNYPVPVDLRVVGTVPAGCLGMSETARRCSWRWGNGKRVGVNSGGCFCHLVTSIHIYAATWCLPVWVLHPRNSCTRVVRSFRWSAGSRVARGQQQLRVAVEKRLTTSGNYSKTRGFPSRMALKGFPWKPCRVVVRRKKIGDVNLSWPQLELDLLTQISHDTDAYDGRLTSKCPSCSRADLFRRRLGRVHGLPRRGG